MPPENARELSTLPDVTVIRTLPDESVSHTFASGLRIIRGTLREEDLIISFTKDYLNDSGLISQLVKAVFAEYYNPKRIVFGPQKIAAFYGWHVQFQLQKEKFTEEFWSTLASLNLPSTNLSRIELSAFDTAPKSKNNSSLKTFATIIPQTWRESRRIVNQQLSLIPRNIESPQKTLLWRGWLRFPLLLQRIMLSTVLIFGIITFFVVLVSPKVNASIAQFFGSNSVKAARPNSK